MIRTEIIVEGNKLDTSADLEAVLTFSIDDIKEFSSRNTKYSKTIVIPGTNQNNFVFGNIFDVNVFNAYNPAIDNVGYNYNAAKAASCLVFVDRIQVFKGVIRILEITIVDGVIEYECAVFGELGGFISMVGDELLETLDFSSYDHTFNETNIQNSWSAPTGSGYYYPLIDYGYTADGINYDILNFLPALYAKEYLDKIMAAAGYTYESAFIEGAEFKKIIIPANVDQGYVEVDTLYHRTRPLASFPSWPIISPGGTPATITFNTDVGTQYATDSSGTITYNRNGNISVLVTGQARVYVANGGFTSIGTRLKLYKNGVAIAGVEDSMTTPATSNSTADLEVIAAVALVQGDTLQLVIESDIGYTEIRYSACVFKAEGQPVAKFTLEYGDDLTMQGFIPKGISRISFFKALVNMFNLYVTEDQVKDKHLIITPYKDFYDTSLSAALDWTAKLDHSKPIKIKPLGELNHKTYEFKYKDDVDYYNALYKNKFTETYGSRKFDTGLEFVRDKKTIELIFAAMVLRQYATTDRVVGAIYKQTNGVKEQYNSVPRIVYRCASNLSCGTWYLKDGVTTLLTLTNYPYAGHVDDPVDPTVDLLWGAPAELYYEADLYPVANLFNVYWDFYVSEITDKDSKLLTAFFKLSPVDILNLDFSKYIFIGGQLFRVNKVSDYNTLEPEVTKCELLNVIEIE